MKTHAIKHLIIFTFAFTTLALTSCKQQANYEIATWHGFKPAVLTYTFDDNTPNQIPVAIPLLDEFDYKATFYIVSGWDNDWSAFNDASKNGHEITSHTISHPALSQLSLDSLDIELRESQDTIRHKIKSAECLTMAYPYCVTASNEMVAKYYIGARICNGQIIPATPDNFYELSSIVVGTEGNLKNANDLNVQTNKTIEANGWTVLLFHSIDNDGVYSPIESSELRQHLNYVRENEDQIWVATFAQAIKYIKERNSATITEKVISRDSILINLTDSLDNTIYNTALTIRRNLPKSWNKGRVYINNEIVESKLEIINEEKQIAFDAIPDTDKVFLVRDAG